MLKFNYVFIKKKRKKVKLFQGFIRIRSEKVLRGRTDE